MLLTMSPRWFVSVKHVTFAAIPESTRTTFTLTFPTPFWHTILSLHITSYSGLQNMPHFSFVNISDSSAAPSTSAKNTCSCLQRSCSPASPIKSLIHSSTHLARNHFCMYDICYKGGSSFTPLFTVFRYTFTILDLQHPTAASTAVFELLRLAGLSFPRSSNKLCMLPVSLYCTNQREIGSNNHVRKHYT